jgi:hypothetical protein
LFVNARGEPLTRFGVRHILRIRPQCTCSNPGWTSPLFSAGWATFNSPPLMDT